MADAAVFQKVLSDEVFEPRLRTFLLRYFDSYSAEMLESLALPAGVSLKQVVGQWILTIPAHDWKKIAFALRDEPDLAFEQLIDVAGVDYAHYRNASWQDAPEITSSRFVAVYQLLSVKHNVRLRVKIALEDDAWPALDSVVDVWSVANWFEREAYDLYGILFEGHPDLRRILTDYGFVGHPFRKDFPLSGYVEMKYDEALKRVVYQPVSIEPREITPRIVREEHYGNR
jgi:NADH-quinone oxidoreductase subunit C